MSLFSVDRSAINADLYDFSDPVQFGRFCEAANAYYTWLMLGPKPRTPAEEQTLLALKNILDDDNVFPRVQQSLRAMGGSLMAIDQSRVFEHNFDTPQGWLLRQLFNRLPPDTSNPGLTFKEQLSLRMHLTELEWRTAKAPGYHKQRMLDWYRSLQREWSMMESKEAKEQSGEAAQETEAQGTSDWSTF